MRARSFRTLNTLSKMQGDVSRQVWFSSFGNVKRSSNARSKDTSYYYEMYWGWRNDDRQRSFQICLYYVFLFFIVCVCRCQRNPSQGLRKFLQGVRNPFQKIEASLTCDNAVMMVESLRMFRFQLCWPIGSQRMFHWSSFHRYQCESDAFDHREDPRWPFHGWWFPMSSNRAMSCKGDAWLLRALKTWDNSHDVEWRERTEYRCSVVCHRMFCCSHEWF